MNDWRVSARETQFAKKIDMNRRPQDKTQNKYYAYFVLVTAPTTLRARCCGNQLVEKQNNLWIIEERTNNNTEKNTRRYSSELENIDVINIIIY